MKAQILLADHFFQLKLPLSEFVFETPVVHDLDVLGLIGYDGIALTTTSATTTTTKVTPTLESIKR